MKRRNFFALLFGTACASLVGKFDEVPKVVTFAFSRNGRTFVELAKPQHFVNWYPSRPSLTVNQAQQFIDAYRIAAESDREAREASLRDLSGALK